MKKGYIVALLLVSAAIAVIVSTLGKSSTYVTFDGAEKLSIQGDDDEVHIIGSLVKNPDGSIKDFNYNAIENPNLCTFYLEDDSARIEKVELMQSPPIDFEKSEKVVVIGSFEDKSFVAKSVLLKCPSKYENKEIK